MFTRADGHGQGHARGRGHGQILMFFDIFSIRHFFHQAAYFFPFDVLSHSAFFPFGVSYYSIFCPIRRFFHLMFCPIRRFFHLTFCPIRRFVFRRFVVRRFFTFGVCYFDILSVNLFHNVVDCFQSFKT
jgi:hypothetical protein